LLVESFLVVSVNMYDLLIKIFEAVEDRAPSERGSM
jgi:hypothetical protein